LLKKKSKSIDNSQKYQSTSISKTRKKLIKNHSLTNGFGNNPLIESIKKPIFKKSLDLTDLELR